MAVLLSTRNKLALTAVCLAAMMSGLEISSVPVILPILEKQIHASFTQLQWIMNAYTLACTTVLMATGTLADRFGRKRLFLISITGFGLTSLLCGAANSPSLIIFGRFLQGMSGGAMLICLIAILSSQFPPGKARNTAFTAWGVVFGFGLGFGPMIGGLIVALASWQWVFLIHVVIAIITGLLAYKNVEESRDHENQQLDVGGVVSLSATVLSLTFYITQGGQIGYLSDRGLFIVGIALLCLMIFIYIERRHPHPMFDFTVFRNRAFSGALLGSIGMNFSFWPFMIYLPIYFQTVLGYDIVTAGLYLLAYTLPTLLMPPLATRLVSRFGAGKVIPCGLLGIGMGFWLMYFGLHGTMGVLPGAVVAGVALGLTNTPVTHTTTGALPANRAGMASGMDMSARLITLAINIAMMGTLLVAGVKLALCEALPAENSMQGLQSLAEKLAGGENSLSPALASVAREALISGFSGVLLYGAAGVCILALASHFLFNFRVKSALGRAEIES
ncbi:MFS transporter [Serratia sp. M24T3]|uniref:MFS transporter n=1 Tax=Serratia sp. M24T3 TaxID=932213 RepID=UPI00025BB65F|nr:MFS transporter [Serratia sp. M24T3]EIC83356.1 major facilitator superfamily protein [Serratia sp. M24T3]